MSRSLYTNCEVALLYRTVSVWCAFHGFTWIGQQGAPLSEFPNIVDAT